MDKTNNTGKLLGALLVGTAIGAILGILFAPDKGSVTRKKLLSKGEDLKDSMQEKLNNFLHEAKKGAEATNDKLKVADANHLVKAYV